VLVSKSGAAVVIKEGYIMNFFELQHRFYSVEVSLSLVVHLSSSDPQGFATDPCSIHGGTNLLSISTISFWFVRGHHAKKQINSYKVL